MPNILKGEEEVDYNDPRTRIVIYFIISGEINGKDYEFKREEFVVNIRNKYCIVSFSTL